MLLGRVAHQQKERPKAPSVPTRTSPSQAYVSSSLTLPPPLSPYVVVKGDVGARRGFEKQQTHVHRDRCRGESWKEASEPSSPSGLGIHSW